MQHDVSWKAVNEWVKSNKEKQAINTKVDKVCGHPFSAHFAWGILSLDHCDQRVLVFIHFVCFHTFYVTIYSNFIVKNPCNTLNFSNSCVYNECTIFISVFEIFCAQSCSKVCLLTLNLQQKRKVELFTCHSQLYLNLKWLYLFSDLKLCKQMAA